MTELLNSLIGTPMTLSDFTKKIGENSDYGEIQTIYANHSSSPWDIVKYKSNIDVSVKIVDDKLISFNILDYRRDK